MAWSIAQLATFEEAGMLNSNDEDVPPLEEYPVSVCVLSPLILYPGIG